MSSETANIEVESSEASQRIRNQFRQLLMFPNVALENHFTKLLDSNDSNSEYQKQWEELKPFVNPRECLKLFPSTLSLITTPSNDAKNKSISANSSEVPPIFGHAMSHLITEIASEGEGEAGIAAMLETMASKDSSQSIGPCGKYFRKGDLTFRCATCGMDPTCVLCVDCFKQQNHEKHDTYMNTSHGGGMCDCGVRNDQILVYFFRKLDSPKSFHFIFR
jgi:hypothetical protein